MLLFHPGDGSRVSLCSPAVVKAVFALLVILGIVVALTTAGAGDSERTKGWRILKTE